MKILGSIHPGHLVLLFLVSQVESEKVLIFHGASSYSHRVQTWPIAVALAEKGHQVTYISPHPPKEPHPNITEIVPKKMRAFLYEFEDEAYDINVRVRKDMKMLYLTEFPLSHGVCEGMLASQEFKDWLGLKENQKFDLAIVDNCLPECGVGLAHRLGVEKVILFSTIATIAHEYDSIGFLPQSSAIPEIENAPLSTPMGFFERIYNTYLSLRWRWEHYLYCQKIDALLREKLAMPKMPYIEDLLRNTSLNFYTGDVVTDYPRSLPPYFVNVAGIHCRESEKALPKDVEAFLNSTIKSGEKNDGFVYISLGSLVVASNLPENVKQVLFSVVRSFPHLKFLWKWDGEPDSNIPENLYLSKWFPQIDVLSHPKIRAFVTQSGRPSTLEALFLAVPMISFPVVGDQDLNANRMEEMGATIKLEIATVTFKEFRDAVEKVVYDPKVKERLLQLQRILRDRPMTPLETAMWWIDYVRRHEDTSHLRPAGNDQYWFVRRQVDVWAFVSIGAFLLFAGVLGAGWTLWGILMGKPAPKKLKTT